MLLHPAVCLCRVVSCIADGAMSYIATTANSTALNSVFIVSLPPVEVGAGSIRGNNAGTKGGRCRPGCKIILPPPLPASTSVLPTVPRFVASIPACAPTSTLPFVPACLPPTQTSTFDLAHRFPAFRHAYAQLTLISDLCPRSIPVTLHLQPPPLPPLSPASPSCTAIEQSFPCKQPPHWVICQE